MAVSTMKLRVWRATRSEPPISQGRGYRVLRFWNNDVLGNVEGVMETIAAAVRDVGPPPPTPPRHASHGGRGEHRLRPERAA